MAAAASVCGRSFIFSQ